MKFWIRVPALLMSAVVLCAPLLTAPAAAFAAPKKALCAVCSVREGAGPEEVKATVKHDGKQYAFCSTNCRDEFLKNPKEFLKASAPPTAPEADHKDHQHGPAPKGAGSSAPS